MGLIVLPGLVLYLIMSIVLVKRVGQMARGKGRSPLLWGGLVALVLYLIPFWDWIPTVVLHEYYCRKEAGFWVYKTLDQWMVEHPGVFESIADVNDQELGSSQFHSQALYKGRFLYSRVTDGPLPFNRRRNITEISDINNNEVLAREVRFSTKQEPHPIGELGWKMWLYNEKCDMESHRDKGSINQMLIDITGAKR